MNCKLQNMIFLIKLIDYNIILINLILIAMIAILLLIINFVIRQKNNKLEINTQKYSAYECGFEPFSETQANVFEIQFFLVSIMFLIFDVELALMFPWAVHFEFLSSMGFWIMMFFIILLTVGFLYEWQKGALNWNSIQNVPTAIHLSICIWMQKFEYISNVNESIFYKWNDIIYTYIDYAGSMEQLMALAILILLILGVVQKYFITNNLNSVQIQQFVTYIFYMVCIFLTIKLLFANPMHVEFLFHNYFIIDFYTQITKLIISLCVLVAILFWAKDYIYYHKYIVWEFPILMLLASFFIMLLLSSFNLFSLFISLEGLSLCLYILAAYNFDSRSSGEAALKYFTLGTLSSGFLLLGIVFIYISVGTLDYFSIYNLTNPTQLQPLLRTGSCLVFFSFIFKLGAWPCHQWVPDVYQGSPTIVTAFFATGVKAAIFFTVLRLFNFIIIEKPLLAIICIMSLFTGIAGALKTDKIKKFIAYAAINQMGFLLLGVFVYASNAVILYFIFYILTTVMIFMIILKTLPISKTNTSEITFLSDFRLLTFYNKNISLYILIILFSMAGLPPFITSFTKWYILLILANNNYIILLGITIFLTIFSIYYYIRLVKHIFFESQSIIYQDLPTYYFKNNEKENRFLLISAFLLISGSIFVYIFCNKIVGSLFDIQNYSQLNLLSTLFLIPTLRVKLHAFF